MPLAAMKLLLVLFASVSGYFIFRQIVGNTEIAFIGSVSGMFIAFIALVFEKRVNNAPLRIVLGGAIGLITGLVMANLFTYPFASYFFENSYLEISLYLFANSIVGYLGLSIGMKKGEEFNLDWHGILKEKGGKPAHKYVIDTSVIIDGRVEGICQAGFIEGSLIIPKFVLAELQYIADLEDPVKKARGVRGLDMLKSLKKEKTIELTVSDEDFPNIAQVDMKLVEFARKYSAKILTNDVNLNKVASIHGVTVLNINSLANALKPTILPGETIKIPVIKEGKEDGQGIGYLDDGTMVVIDNGVNYRGSTVETIVTSILQTTTGRMIFARLMEERKMPAPFRAVT